MWLDVEAGPQEDRLIKRLFHDNHYYVSSRPVPVESNAIEVKFGITLQQIIDVVSRRRNSAVAERPHDASCHRIFR